MNYKINNSIRIEIAMKLIILIINNNTFKSILKGRKTVIIKIIKYLNK